MLIQGKLYGVGVGPGDPELLTIKAQRILNQVEVLFVPRSDLEKRSLALTIIDTFRGHNQEVIDLHLPMRRDQGELKPYRQAAADKIIRVLGKGQDAAFITLGDPGMYSTFGYLLREIKRIAPEAEIEIIPGVSAVNSISAWIKEPLAEGEESLVIVPATIEPERIASIVQNFDNIVLLKAGREIDKIKAIAREQIDLKKVVFTSRCGFSDGFFSEDWEALQGSEFDYLSTVVIKKKRGQTG